MTASNMPLPKLLLSGTPDWLAYWRQPAPCAAADRIWAERAVGYRNFPSNCESDSTASNWVRLWLDLLR